MTKKELGFPAMVGREGKITIPHEIRKLLDLKKGDTIYVTEIRKLEPGALPQDRVD